jgi:hypothetical protein
MNGTLADPEGKHLVILVHGINTNAQWFPLVKGALEEAGFIAAPAGYGIYGVLRFLLPINRLRRAAINRVYENIRIARSYYKPASISIIAHSFGTYVVSRIIAENFDIELDRIIFCGSVVQNDFRFQDVQHRFRPLLYNEIGTRDYWPVVASAITWGYGSVGSDGFQNPVVNDRWHKDFTHSDFLTREFCKKYYIPSLRGESVPGDEAAPFPFWVRFVARTPVKWILAIILLVAAVLSSAFIVRNAPPPALLVSEVIDLFKPLPPPPHVDPPPPQWRQLPVGTQYAPRSGPVMTFSNVDKSSLDWKIDPGQIVPPSSADGRWEEATVKGTEWLRIALPNGGYAYVPKSDLKLVVD